MKIKKKEQLIAHPLKKALAVSLSALMAGFVFSATASYASDIEIYQQARSGNISLMFVLDISGSMRYFDANNQELTSCSSGARETAFSGNGISYNRRYCEISSREYYYMRSGGRNNRKWYRCGGAASGSTSVNKTDCTYALTSEPSLSGLDDDGGGNPQYYYKNGASTPYYDRITLVKDAMYSFIWRKCHW